MYNPAFYNLLVDGRVAELRRAAQPDIPARSLRASRRRIGALVAAAELKARLRSSSRPSSGVA
jgi:hypothetical protein